MQINSKIKFNGAQLKNPTPTSLSNFIQVFTVIGGIIIGWVGTANFIPLETAGMIQSILGLLVGIANGIKPFFGVETNQSDIPIDQVGEMDTKKNS
jgi:hypothetical protein